MRSEAFSYLHLHICHFISVFKHHIHVRQEISWMFFIGNHNEELIVNTLNIGICDKVLHRQCRQVSSSESRSFTSCQGMQVSVFCHISDITCMQPYSSVLMSPQCLCCRFRCIISQHKPRSADADFSLLIICQFFFCPRSEYADNCLRQRNSHVTV